MRYMSKDLHTAGATYRIGMDANDKEVAKLLGLFQNVHMTHVEQVKST